MPFSHILTGVGGNTYILNITSEDLTSNYVIESEIISQFGGAGTVPGDRVVLNIAAVALVASNTGVYCIDGDTLNDNASLLIEMTAGSLIAGRGGAGGKGGNGFWAGDADDSDAGGSAFNGGHGIRFGCPTDVIGSGTIQTGYGGGGGGGGGATGEDAAHGGGGGGGGAALGAGGAPGIDENDGDDDGTAGGTATNTTEGSPGPAGGANGGQGGQGGDPAVPAFGGSNGVRNGGSKGLPGNAINSQGFAHTEGGSITVNGATI